MEIRQDTPTPPTQKTQGGSKLAAKPSLEDRFKAGGPGMRVSYITGLALIASGLVLLADQYLKTGWLSLLIMPTAGLAFLGFGFIHRRLALIIPGGVLTGLGIGSFLAFSSFFIFALPIRLGLLLLAFALGWGVIALFSAMYSDRVAWWPLIPGSVFAGTGACLLLSPLRVVDFALYIGLALGLMFIAWGANTRLIGLVIPGAIVLSGGLGVYLGWGHGGVINGLSDTGVMLVYFSLGWGLITVFSRFILDKFVWWPLIPGGILAMTGWGLYLGGNPGTALAFISNTGSIGLILLGLYLLVWRRGIRR